MWSHFLDWKLEPEQSLANNGPFSDFASLFQNHLIVLAGLELTKTPNKSSRIRWTGYQVSVDQSASSNPFNPDDIQP